MKKWKMAIAKKVICATLIALVAVSGVACSKSEEEIRKEVKAELEAEMKAEAEANAEDMEKNTSEDSETSALEGNEEDDKETDQVQEEAEEKQETTYLDVHDSEAIFTFLTALDLENPMTREAFEENMKVYYVDINSDGHEDVIYQYDEFSDETFFILSDIGKYSWLRYATLNESLPQTAIESIEEIQAHEQLLVITGKNQDSLYEDERTDIYSIGSDKMTLVASLQTFLDNGMPENYFSGKGQIVLEEGYDAFKYTYKQERVQISDGAETRETQIVRNLAYVYNFGTQSYDITEDGENINIFEQAEDSEAETDTSYVLLENLKVGDTVDGFTITYLESGNDGYTLTFSGQAEQTGKLEYSDYMDGYMFATDDALFQTEIRDKSDTQESFGYTGPQYVYISDEAVKTYLKNDEIEYMEAFNPLRVKIQYENPSVSVHYGTEGGESVDVLSIEVLDEVPASSPKKLTGYAPDTFNGKTIDYEKYQFVLLPTWETVNKDMFSYTKYYFPDDNTEWIGKDITIFGTMKDVKITYIDNMSDEGTTKTFDKIENIQLSLRAPFNTDASVIRIEGKVYTDGEHYEDVLYILDDSRDLSDYEPLAYE